MVGFPVKDREKTWQQRCAQESFAFGPDGSKGRAYTNATLNTGDQVTQMYTLAGRAAWIDQVEVQNETNKDLQLQVYEVQNGIGAAGYIGVDTGFAYNHEQRKKIKAGETGIFKFSSPFWIPENTQLKLRYTDVQVTGVTGFVQMSCGATEFTNDLNWNADFTYLLIADSIGKGSLGAINSYISTDMYGWMIRDYYRFKGQDVRIVNKAEGGRTTSDMAAHIKNGYCDVKSDLITYCMGVNDAQSGLNNSEQLAVAANIDALIKWQQGIQAGSNMLVMGPGPAEEAVREGGCVLVRQIMAARVQAAIDQGAEKLWYHNFGGINPSGSVSFYSDQDTPGDRIHWSKIGHLAAMTEYTSWADINLPLIK